MQKNKWGIKEKTKVMRIPESYIAVVDKAIFSEKWRREYDAARYSKDFVDWLNRYFSYKPVLYRYRRKRDGVMFTIEELRDRYEQAMPGDALR